MNKVTYELIDFETGSQAVKRTNADDTVCWIPLDERNSDYQRYLRWLENPDAEEGGTL